MAGPSEPKRRGQLGDFEIGRGVMGIVYEAPQVSLNRKVVLKVLAGSLGLTSKAVVRFRREAEAAAKLHHTNIAPIYTTGEEDGTHFYAMELIEGPSLNVVIRRMRAGEPLTESQATSDGRASAGTSAMPSLWLAETMPQDKTSSSASSGTAASPVSDSSTRQATRRRSLCRSQAKTASEGRRCNVRGSQHGLRREVTDHDQRRIKPT